MKGFMSGGRGVFLALSAITLAGCQTLSTVTDGSGCSNCARGPGGRDHGGIFEGFEHHLENFDWEQLQSDHCWPEQYARESSRRVNAVFGQQQINGNRVELTIWKHNFETDEGSEDLLNPSGILRLQYLARKKPFVIPYLELQTSFDTELDNKRIASIIEESKLYAFEPTVSIVNREPVGQLGVEAPKAMSRMLGAGVRGVIAVPQDVPYYESRIMRTFN